MAYKVTHIQKTELSLDEIMLLYVVHCNSDVERKLNELKEQKLIGGTNGKYYLKEEAKEHLCSIFVEDITKETAKREKQINICAEKLKEIFPKGTKGNFPWSESTKLIVKRLLLFEKKYGKYDYEHILDAAKRYVKSFGIDTTYMKTLKYFIFKEKYNASSDIESESELLNYLEDKTLGTETSNNPDWNIEML